MPELTDNYVSLHGLNVHQSLYDLVAKEIAPGTGISADDFWKYMAEIVIEFSPINKRLLEKRDQLQKSIDEWCAANRERDITTAETQTFLSSIGYLVEEGPPFRIDVANVDSEIASINAPQLVVPVDNARYALNAVNARWGSLYDALYNSEIVEPFGDKKIGAGYDPERGDKVIAWGRAFLDRIFPLENGSHADVTHYFLTTKDDFYLTLSAKLEDGSTTFIKDSKKFAGFRGHPDNPRQILLVNNGLHIRIPINRESLIGKTDKAGIRDISVEAAVTTIQDLEDAIAAVDAEDKTNAYRNWLYLMKGTLNVDIEKFGRVTNRALNSDQMFLSPTSSPLRLRSRSLMLIRHTGLHMYTDAVTTKMGRPIPEGFLDAMVTTLCAMHNLKDSCAFPNSQCKSIYVVKPKLHGPVEVATTVELFKRVEELLGLPLYTLKIGIMDEERRTTVNLNECIRAANHRAIFINTGFLDRTGDEIHTMMELGPAMPKEEIKQAPWLLAYEDWNVDAGIRTGLSKIGQIGKGMWTMPDLLKQMLEVKSNHPTAGANTAWVPSPAAATIHALHYHDIDVNQVQQELRMRDADGLTEILTPPLLGDRPLTTEEIDRELENNAQGILGYVVHWVEEGIGCSKIPDINGIDLMEDRATLRISSQHIANWIRHGITNKEKVLGVFKKMAAVVDSQNEGNEGYRPLSPDYDNSVAFQAALDLVFQGCESPNGYTEEILHTRRREAKRKYGS